MYSSEKKDNRFQYKNWDADLLSSEVLKHYFISKEAIQTYCSCLGIVRKREIALEVESTLVAFLEYEYSDEELFFLDSLIRRNNKIIKRDKSQDRGLFNRLKNLDKNSVLLLGIDESIDLPKLKLLYREAFVRHHPDRGGSVETMQQINEAFTLFHDAIVNYFPINGKSSITFRENSPTSISDWKFTCYLVLSCIQGDFFAVDKSFISLKNSYELSKQVSNEYVGIFSSSLMDWSGGVLDKCCSTLRKMEMYEELKEAVNITSYYIDLSIKYLQPVDEHDLKPIYDDYPSKNPLESELRTNIVINHPEQAKNAFRLGKIDEKRFQKTMKKYEDRENEFINKADDLKSFYKRINPQVELTKSDYKLSVVNPQIIAPISFFQDRYDLLYENQKWEYINAFSLNLDSKQLVKYIEIRNNEVILGLIKNYDCIDKSKIKVELSYLEKNFGSGTNAYSSTLELIEYIEALDDRERVEKLRLLTDIDKTENRFFSRIDLRYKPQNAYQKRIEANDCYIEFAKMAYADILRYKNTGEYNNNFSDFLNKDLMALIEFDKTPVSKLYWGNTKNTQKEDIDLLKSYTEALLKLGKTFHKRNTGKLNIGTRINRLTIEYAKLKKWEDVIFWAELFFNLPKNYRDNMSKKELEVIKKRLERSKKELD